MQAVFSKSAAESSGRKTWFHPRFSKNVWIWIWVFLLFDLLLNILWMYTVPMTKAPDEEVRIILSDYIMAHGSLPNAWDEAVRINGWGFSYALRPLLVNMIGAFNMWVVSLFTSDLWAQVLAVRLISALSGTAMVYFVFRCAEWLDWKPCWAFMAGFICAMMPQITFLASYHNNDLFSLACVTAVLYCWLRGMKENWTWADCTRLSVSMGLTILSYYNAYPYVLFSIPLFFATAFHKGMSREQKIETWKKTGYIVLLTFLIAGWFFIRNMILYDGDMLGMKTRLIMGERYADPALRPSAVFKAQREGISFFGLWNYFHGDPFSWSQKTFMSTIALLGNMDFLFPAEIYRFCAAVLQLGSALFAVQAIVWLIQQCRTHFASQEISFSLLFFLLAFLAGVFVIGLSLYYSWTDDYQPQGRYIIPAFTTFVLILTAGFRFLFQSLGKLFRHPLAETIMSCLFAFCMCAVMAGMQAYAYWRIAPVYLDGLPRTTQTYAAHREKFGPSFTRSSIDDELDRAASLEKERSGQSSDQMDSASSELSSSSAAGESKTDNPAELSAESSAPSEQHEEPASSQEPSESEFIELS